MKLVACAALAAALVATACGVEQSKLDSNAQVTVTGKVLAADGSPLVKTRVALIRELDLGQAIGGLFVTVVTLGVACLSDHPPALCANNSHIATTASDGAYSFSVHGGDTQGSLGIASTMEVLVSASAGAGQVAGPVALAEFKVQTTTVSLPDLRLWNPTLEVSSVDLAMDPRSVRVVRPSLPASGYGTGAKYSLEFDDAKGRPVWVAGLMVPDFVMGSRILEDTGGTGFVRAKTNGSANNLAVDFTLLTGSFAFHGSAGAPPSRGAPCAAVTAGGMDAFKAPCALTSGDFGGAFTAGANATGVVIDLGQIRSLSLVVVRGCSGQCPVAAGSDLSSLQEVSTVAGEYWGLAPARSARYVRVMGSSVSLLRQISVW